MRTTARNIRVWSTAPWADDVACGLRIALAVFAALVLAGTVALWWW